MLVPVMDGWLVRLSVQTWYEEPSEVTVPSWVAPEHGLSKNFDRTSAIRSSKGE